MYSGFHGKVHVSEAAGPFTRLIRELAISCSMARPARRPSSFENKNGCPEKFASDQPPLQPGVASHNTA